MTINLTVRAEVVDIHSDTPQPNDTLFVDTNVWLWQTYGLPPESNPNRARRAEQKLRLYTGYLSSALVCGAELKYCGLILSELAHVIEKTEFDIFKRRNNLPSLQAKEYRHNYLDEHIVVAARVRFAWDQVTMLASSADLMVNARLANTAVSHFQSVALDGYDLFLLEAIRQTGISPVQVLTDDMDYATVPNIQLFTGNGLVIRCADEQGKLISRGQ